MSGFLSTNTNGSMQQLAITDPFNSPDNQTCNYTHDDLGRVSTANCGGAWSQTFTYDPFGNVTKSGNSSWLPGYDTNNHYTLGGTSYDANGNLKNDTLNAYTWNADTTPATINSAAITSDALGRTVEVQNGTSGPLVEIAYSPSGGPALAGMAGQSIGMGFVPLPGNATAIYTSTGLTYYSHADRVGSTRLLSSPSRSPIPTMAYAPFGEGYAGGLPGFSIFTTGGFSFTQFDTENGSGSLEDFMFRRYSPSQSRWVAPDPAGLAAVNPSDPQSWNRYAYVGNRPLSNTDPSGLFNLPCDGDCFGGGGGGDPNPCDFGDDPFCGSGPCDVIFDPFCNPGGGPPGGGPPSGGPPGGSPGAPPQRTGGVWPNNVTLGLPAGLNVSPLGLGSLFGLSPGTQCGDFAPCGFPGLGPFSFTTPDVLTLPWPQAVGSIFDAILGGILALTMSMTGDNVNHCQDQPCVPPRGTQCYEKQSGHKHNGWDPHYHIWTRGQNQTTCQCFWNRGSGTDGATEYPPSGMTDCNTYATWPSN